MVARSASSDGKLCTGVATSETPIVTVLCAAGERAAGATMLATISQACALSTRASKSFARRQFLLSQANVRSTTHRRGRRTKPFAALGRFTLSTVQRPRLANASLSVSPAYP